MRALLNVAICLLFLSGTAHSDDFDFRKTRWGMSLEEVIQAEGKKPDYIPWEDVAYVFEDQIDGVNYNVIYYFLEWDGSNQLASARSIHAKRYINRGKYVEDFEKLKKTNLLLNTASRSKMKLSGKVRVTKVSVKI